MVKLIYHLFLAKSWKGMLVYLQNHRLLHSQAPVVFWNPVRFIMLIIQSS